LSSVNCRLPAYFTTHTASMYIHSSQVFYLIFSFSSLKILFLIFFFTKFILTLSRSLFFKLPWETLDVLSVRKRKEIRNLSFGIDVGRVLRMIHLLHANCENLFLDIFFCPARISSDS
jgi:hypothetical protein